ncbi:MAG: type IV pilus twitching motility protein PilT [Candidatus Eisenbacteria bacterium]|uniref:Type IV pilus twitching motility protein PilT n=1 Tax=Eiseniibacteriota bacterium TaxID=2212470 RepID=A0A948WC55_UNCEI|nr:type IV pilus twitching motility protein PilT [Candidatus Eisenbacteria bacterium]MBU1951205.1 type IV pilus twitching motility protein PilT [Candidatus Eisenbacteria bacterium]MBU2690608.1 type IV pilus twitching motility protein PilT [Candidatus Eisenbacteria bacterium]
MSLRNLLEVMMEKGASDLHLKAGSRPVIRIDGLLHNTDYPVQTPESVEEISMEILKPSQQEALREEREIDLAFGVPGLARFRCNIYFQRGSQALAIRFVPLGVPSLSELNLPPIVENLALLPRGLVLVTGTVGSGKSTTLAAMIDLLNRTQSRNIITIEDPVEFLHRDDRCIINQREVGQDTPSFAAGLKHVLRQDPDVIMLGEIRDSETMSVALMAADTGHLVLSTLHTVDAARTINRVLSFYPPDQHQEVRYLMAQTLAGVVSLRLLPRKDSAGRVPAAEVCIATPTVKEYLMDAAKSNRIYEAMAEGSNTYGMQIFDQSLMKLYSEDLIGLDVALRNATNPTEFRLRVAGIESASDGTWRGFQKGADNPEGMKEKKSQHFDFDS